MRLLQIARLAQAISALGMVATLLAGCGSDLPTSGTQRDATIPKEVAAKQNDAYKEYSKQSKSSLPANASPGQRDRMKKR